LNSLDDSPTLDGLLNPAASAVLGLRRWTDEQMTAGVFLGDRRHPNPDSDVDQNARRIPARTRTERAVVPGIPGRHRDGTAESRRGIDALRGQC
jgi:hypothetical protein